MNEPGTTLTTTEFIRIQDEILELSGRDLAEKLGVAPAAISRWRNGTEIPEYIVKALHLHIALKLGDLKLPLSLNELLAIDRAASKRGLSPAAYILQVLRAGLPEPTRPLYVPAEIASCRLNEDSPAPDPIRKRPA